MTSLQSAILLELIRHLAQGCLTIRISGERGSGKKLFAHHLCRLCNGAQHRLIALNFSQLRPESGADKEKSWAMEVRQRLDDFLSDNAPAVYYLEAIEHLPRNLQDRLAEKIRSAGALSRPSWFLASSIEPLEHHVVEGRCCEALLAAMDMVHISFAPLRAKSEEIPRLLAALLRQQSTLDTFPPVGMPDPQTMKSFIRYPWPGNLSQLRLLTNCAVSAGRWSLKRIDWQALQKDVHVNEEPWLDLADLMPLAELHLQKNKALKILLSRAHPNNTGLLDLALYDEALSQVCD